MTDRSSFSGKLGIQQRVLPAYRRSFFEALTEVCEGGLSIFAGEVHAEESIPTIDQLQFTNVVAARNYHFQKIQSPYYFLWQGGLVEWLNNWNPDVLIIEANPRYLSTGRGIRWMHKRSKSVLGWGLGAPPIGVERSIFRRIIGRWRIRSRERLINQLDAVIAYSHKGAGEYLAIIPPSKRIFTATNAVANRPQGSQPVRPPVFDGRANLLFVGRLQFRKRIDNLLRACASLPENLQPFLQIVGEGPERGNLQKLAATVYPKAEFPGIKHGDELEKHFIMADLFVLPGTGGLAVQEAMAYGLPVIVAEGDGTQQDLVKPENGWLIPANDEAALSSALQEALIDPGRLRIMGAASFKIVQNEINIEQMVNVFVEAINSTSTSTESNR
jgi:glycosyltransferase involved in cell wall biosynthesis